MTLLIDDPDEGASTMEGPVLWKQQFGLSSIFIASDPQFLLVPGSSVGTPQQTVVDPRTMRVVLLQEGWSGSAPAALLQIAQQNKPL